jgi:hypothetical protein
MFLQERFLTRNLLQELINGAVSIAPVGALPSGVTPQYSRSNTSRFVLLVLSLMKPQPADRFEHKTFLQEHWT